MTSRDPNDALRETIQSWFYSNYRIPDRFDNLENGETPDAIIGDHFNNVDEQILKDIASDIDIENDTWFPIDHDLEKAEEDARWQDWFEYEEEKRHQFHTEFENGLSVINQLAGQSMSSSLLDSAFQRMLYAQVFSVLEAYLCDSFTRIVLLNETAKRAYVENHLNPTKKITFKELFKIYDDIDHEINKELQKLVWHRLDAVKSMFRQCCNVDLGDIGFLMKKLSKRNDIVHRNGKSVSGKNVDIVESDVNSFCTEVKEFVAEIEAKLSKLELDNFESCDAVFEEKSQVESDDSDASSLF